jgi:hypothetical protein
MSRPEVTTKELRVLGQALNEVLNGPEAIDDWEFDTRMGVTRDEARSLLQRLVEGLPPLTPEDG